jgi:K+-transporting ATPase ATPase A chain
MTPNGIFQIFLYTAVIIALAKPMGAFMAKVFAGERTWLHRISAPSKPPSTRYCGIDERRSSTGRYASSVLAFSAVSLLFTY